MTDNIIVDTATRIFADLCEPQTVNAAEEGRWPEALWNALEESGLTLTWVPDALGGAGAEMIDGFAVLRVAGRFAAPVPLAETLLAGWLLAQAGISAPQGPMTAAPVSIPMRSSPGTTGITASAAIPTSSAARSTSAARPSKSSASALATSLEPKRELSPTPFCPLA